LETSISGSALPGTAAEPTDEITFSDPYTRLLNKREIARFISKSENSVDRLRKKRVIPFLIVGGAIRFRLRDVEKALARYQVKEVAL
jgi:hypothetical protein